VILHNHNYYLCTSHAPKALFSVMSVHVAVCLSVQKLVNYWSEIDVTW